MVRYKPWYFYDKLNGVELHQAGRNCFILSCSPKISKLISNSATFVGEALAVSCSDIKQRNSPRELVLGEFRLPWTNPRWQFRIWLFKLHWQVAQCFSAALTNNLARRWKGKALPSSELLALHCGRSKRVCRRTESQDVAKRWFETKEQPAWGHRQKEKAWQKLETIIPKHMLCRKNTIYHPSLWRPSSTLLSQFIWPPRVKSCLSRGSEPSLPLILLLVANWRAAQLPCSLLSL